MDEPAFRRHRERPHRAGADLLGLITAIVGAAAGSNLAVIVFDIVEDRRPIIVPEAAVAMEVPARVDA